MNRDAVLQFILSLFSSWIVYPALPSELSALIAKSGFEDKFFNALLVRLKILSHSGAQAAHPEWFESLKNADGIYSMRIFGKGFNIRILYGFSPSQSPLLLLAFHERSGKRKTDYTSYIPAAQQRLAELLEENA